MELDTQHHHRSLQHPEEQQQLHRSRLQVDAAQFWPRSSDERSRPPGLGLSRASSDLPRKSNASATSSTSSFLERLEGSLQASGELARKSAKDVPSVSLVGQLAAQQAEHRLLADRVAQLADDSVKQHGQVVGQLGECEARHRQLAEQWEGIATSTQPLHTRLATLEAQLVDQHRANDDCGKQHSAVVWRLGALESNLQQEAERSCKARAALQQEAAERLARVEEEWSSRLVACEAQTAAFVNLRDEHISLRATCMTQLEALRARMNQMEETCRTPPATECSIAAKLLAETAAAEAAAPQSRDLEELQRRMLALETGDSREEALSSLVQGRFAALEAAAETLVAERLAALEVATTAEPHALKTLAADVGHLQDSVASLQGLEQQWQTSFAEECATCESRVQALQESVYGLQISEQQVRTTLAAERAEREGRLDGLQERLAVLSGEVRSNVEAQLKSWRDKLQEELEEQLAALRAELQEGLVGLQALPMRISGPTEPHRDEPPAEAVEEEALKEEPAEEEAEAESEMAQLAWLKVQGLRASYLQRLASSAPAGDQPGAETPATVEGSDTGEPEVESVAAPRQAPVAAGEAAHDERVRSLQRGLAAVEVLVRKEIAERSADGRRLWDALADRSVAAQGDIVGARVQQFEARVQHQQQQASTQRERRRSCSSLESSPAPTSRTTGSASTVAAPLGRWTMPESNALNSEEHEGKESAGGCRTHTKSSAVPGG